MIELDSRLDHDDHKISSCHVRLVAASKKLVPLARPL